MPDSNATAKVALGAAVVVGAATAGGLAYLYKQHVENNPPSKWRRVGEITEINCYPIKSCAPVRPRAADCGPLGVEDGLLRDRVFMVVTPENQFVTARAQPKMVLIQPRVSGHKLILQAPVSSTIEIDFNKLKQAQHNKTYVWNQEVDTVDCGDEVAHWLSWYILGQDSGLRLAYYPNSYPSREIREKNQKFKITPNDAGGLHDATAYMLINQGSMDELNKNMDHVITPLQFRPNFVVKGPNAYDEDNWNWVRIGENVVFRNVKPCTRCIFTNIDPLTGERNPNQQPLTFLKKNRSYLPGESPVLGTHIGLRHAGRVRIGDAVYVEDRN